MGGCLAGWRSLVGRLVDCMLMRQNVNMWSAAGLSRHFP